MGDFGSGLRATYTSPLSGPKSGSLKISLELQRANAGVPWPSQWPITQPLTNDVELLVYGELTLEGTAVQRFALCDLPTVQESIAAVGQNSDTVDLEVRQGPYQLSCFAAGETACLFLTKAVVKINGTSQTIEDRSRLVYFGSHHNWADQFIIFLSPAIGNIGAVVAKEPVFGVGDPDGKLVYLDSSNNPLSTQTATWQVSTP